MKNIPAKPTKFDGITYRSKLEATWALYYSLIMGLPGNRIEEFLYESWADVIEPEDVNYTPDIALVYNESDGDYVLFQEVKPLFPGPAYLEQTLIPIASAVGRKGVPIVLSVGTFFQESKQPEIRFYPYSLGITLSSFAVHILGVSRDDASWAHTETCNFRWDLYDGGSP